MKRAFLLPVVAAALGCGSEVDVLKARDCDGIWGEAFGGGSYDRLYGTEEWGTDIGLAADGDIVVLGKFRDAIDLGGGLITDNPEIGLDETFLVRLDPCGKPRFGMALRVPETLYTQVTHFALDGAGNIVLVESVLPSGQSVIQKLGPDGAELWSRSIDADVDLRDVAVTSDGAIVAIGNFYKTMSLGGDDITPPNVNMSGFVTRFEPDGSPGWLRVIAAPHGTYSELIGLRLDPSGNVVVMGGVAGAAAVDFGGGPLQGGPEQEVAVVSLAADGSHRWSKRFSVAGGSGEYVVVDPRLVDVDGAGAVFVAGVFTKHQTVATSPEPTQSQQMFLARLDPDGAESWSGYFGAEYQQFAELQLVADSEGDALLAGRISGGGVSFGGAPVDEGHFLASFDPTGAHLASASEGDLRIGSLGKAPTGGWLITGDGISSFDGKAIRGSFVATLDRSLSTMQLTDTPLAFARAALDGKGGFVATGYLLSHQFWGGEQVAFGRKWDAAVLHFAP